MTLPRINLVGIGVFVGVAILGVLYRLAKLITHRCFALRCFKKYQQYKQRKDYATYKWLLRKRFRIAQEMKINGYGEHASVAYIIKHLTDEYALVRCRPLEFHFEEYIGLLDYRCQELVRGCCNPFTLPIVIITQPVHFIFDVLLDGLKTVRIINYDTYYLFSHHKVIRFIKGIISALLVPFAVISGWDDFLKFFSDRGLVFLAHSSGNSSCAH